MDEINKYEIFKQLKLNQDFVKKIKLFHVFEDNWNKINLIIVTNDDETYVFGDNRYGLLGFGYSNKVKILTLNENLSNKQIVDFKNSRIHAIARTIDGKVYCWGWNYRGVLGNGRNDRETHKPELNQHLSDKNIVDICCGYAHSLALTIDGQVHAWGQNDYGQIGNGNYDVVSIPYHVNEFNGEKVKAIACGWNHSMALTKKGNVFSWGDNNSGQLGFKKLNKDDSRNAPKLIEINEVFEKINCGRYHSFLLSRDGDIYVFGSNEYEKLGDEKIKEKSETPLKLKNENKFIDIASYWCYSISMALSKEGKIFIWGQCGKEVIETPTEKQFKSFNEVFAHHFQATYKTVVINEIFGNGIYAQVFNETEVIGSGSFGIVSEAKNQLNNKLYAIKKIPINSELGKYVKRELDILRKLKSDLVVKIESIWVEDNYYRPNGWEVYRTDTNISSIHKVFDQNNKFLIHIQMELCLFTLKDAIKKLNQELDQKANEILTPLSYFIASELLSEILEAVNYLHKQDPPIIHRDLKPTNILISDGLNGRFIKLADFHLAVFHEYENQSHTQGLEAYKYMAPEMKIGRDYDAKADIYSLGIIISDLFNFVIKDSSERIFQPPFNINMNFPIEEDSILKGKYSKLFDLTNEMISDDKDKRPNCEHTLSEKDCWALSLSQLMEEKEFHYIEDSIHLHFIQTKLRFYENSLKINTKSSVKYNLFSNDIEEYTESTEYMEYSENRRYSEEFVERKFIASGSYGVVYEAKNKRDNQFYAIKKIPISEPLTEKMIKEIEILSKLKSNFVVKVKSFWTENNYIQSDDYNQHKNISSGHVVFDPHNPLLLHIQMELCSNTLEKGMINLNSELNRKPNQVMSPLGYYISCELFIEILEAVNFLHEQNPQIIHRDLKPTNILVSQQKNNKFIKLGDFGLATIHEFDGQSHTKYSGTREYRAPEVLKTTKYDTKADIYSLGVITEELFNVDIDNESIGQNSDLEEKYPNLIELIASMRLPQKNKRPNCQKILNERNSWALSLNESRLNPEDVNNILEKVLL